MSLFDEEIVSGLSIGLITFEFTLDFCFRGLEEGSMVGEKIF